MASTAAIGARGAARRLGERAAGLLARRASGRDLLGGDRDLTRLAALAGRRPRLRERHRSRSQVALDDLVEDPGRLRLRRRDRLAVGAHLDRERHTGEPRQPLRAASAGDDAEEHLGLSDFRVLDRDPVVAGHRHLEPPAERLAVDCGDERLGGVLETAEQRVGSRRAGHRLVAGLQYLEDVDVGARDERIPGADQDHRDDSGIAVRARDALIDGFPDAGAKRVDGRVIDRQDGDTDRRAS